MAPNFRHGSGGVRVLLNHKDLSGILRDSSVEASVDTAETTTYRTSTGGATRDKTFIPGHRDATANFDGLFDGSTAAVDQVIEDALGSATQQRWTVGPEDDAIGRYAVLILSDHTEFTISAPADDVVSATAAVQASNRRGGVWLAPLAARTSTGALTGVTDGSTTAGGSTAGAVAHLHVTAISTASTAAPVVKVQHSSDGSSFTDLITFAASTAVGSQRGTATGAVKETVRAIVTSFPGTTAKSATFAVAFARNPRRS